MSNDTTTRVASAVFDNTLPRRDALKLLAASSAAVTAYTGGRVATLSAAQSDDGEPVPGGTLTVAIDSDVIGIDPHGASAGVDRNVYTTVYNGLVVPDENLEIQPDLAESWEISDDGTVYTFTLREGVLFHDGTPCDAEAVKWNFDWILDEANASARRGEIVNIDTVTAVDERTVEIVLKTPFAPFLSIISDRAGYIVSPTARQEFGEDYTRNPVGTGPFKFVEWVADDHITFERNEDYFEEGLPYLDEITYRPIPDASVALTELRTENIDFLFAVDPKDVEGIKGEDNLQYLTGPGVGYQGLWVNTVSGPLAEQALREAVSLAIDREALMVAAYFNIGDIAAGPIPPSSWAYDPDYPTVQRDLDAARAKLEEGGQPDGFEMVLKASNTPEQLKITQIMQASLAEVGIQVEIEMLEFGALLDAGAAGEFDALSLGWSGRIDPDGNIQPIFQTGGTFNYGKYDNPEVNDLIDQARTELDQATRAELYQQIQDIINADAAYIFTYFPPASFAAVNRVKGFVVGPDALMRFKSTWVEQ